MITGRPSGRLHVDCLTGYGLNLGCVNLRHTEGLIGAPYPLPLTRARRTVAISLSSGEFVPRHSALRSASELTVPALLPAPAGAPVLVGRPEEILALDALFRDCAQGQGTVAVIRGPVASGKTTLLRAFAERAAAAGAIFLSAVASRAERGLALGIVDQLFIGSPLPASIAPQVA